MPLIHSVKVLQEQLLLNMSIYAHHTVDGYMTYKQNGFGCTVTFVVTQYLVLLMQSREPTYAHHSTRCSFTICRVISRC